VGLDGGRDRSFRLFLPGPMVRRKDVPVVVGHHGLGGVSRPDLLAGYDERDLDFLGGHLLEFGLDLDPLGGTRCVGEYRFVYYRWDVDLAWHRNRLGFVGRTAFSDHFRLRGRPARAQKKDGGTVCVRPSFLSRPAGSNVAGAPQDASITDAPQPPRPRLNPRDPEGVGVRRHSWPARAIGT
jgi:hypothetical protein